MPSIEDHHFRIVDRVGAAVDLISHPIERSHDRIACFCLPTTKALVLGSSQSPDGLNAGFLEREGIESCRRRSGGSAVLVGPSEQLWLDVFVPAGDPLFEFDVCRATWWLGELWRESLISCGLSPEAVCVHRSRFQATKFSDRVCFLGRGPGEIEVDGQKLVGLSQRRDRRGAWFFTMAMVSSQATMMGDIFMLDDDDRRALLKESTESTTGLRELGLDGATLRNELAERLWKRRLETSHG